MWSFKKKNEKYILKKGDYSFQYGVDQFLNILSEKIDCPLIIESQNLENNNCHYPLKTYIQYEARSTLYTAGTSLIDGKESILELIRNFDLNHLYFSGRFEKSISDSYTLEKFVKFRNLQYYSEVYCRLDLTHEYIGLEFASERQEILLEVLEKLSKLMQIEKI